MSSAASNSPPPLLQQTFHAPPVTIVLTVILLVFFLLGFFSIYFCRWFMQAIFNTWHLRQTPSGNLVGRNNSDIPPGGAHSAGLDPALIKSFPSFVYSSVKQVREEKYGRECAICLVEFEDDSLLRLLTRCYHVFHQECVDLWLESHKTCPVCRRDLDNSPHLFADEPSANIDQPNNSNCDNNNNVTIDVDTAVTIDVKDEIGDLHDFRAEKHLGGGDSSNNTNRIIAERFSRSHSTGHSIARARTRSELEEEEEEEGRDDHDDQDRHRLRLPEHMKTKLLRGHHWTASCDTYGEFRRPSTVGLRFGEVSGSHN